MTSITGNTYPVRKALNRLGGRWNPDTRSWDVPDDRANEARRLVLMAWTPRTYFDSRYAHEENIDPGHPLNMD